MQTNQFQKFPTLNNNEFILLKTLGKGLNSKVKKGFHQTEQKNYAIKIIHAENYQANLATIQKEIVVLQKLNHPNIINLLGFHENRPYVKTNGQVKQVTYLVLELGEKGELFDYVANSGYFSENISRFYFKQLMSAIEYCHSQGVTHRDLKPENLLYDEQFNLKVADFGFANIKENNSQVFNYTKLGTPAYMCPELHYNQPYKAEKADIFAAGIILFILAAGTPPFNEAKKTDSYYRYIWNNNPLTFWKAHARFKPQGFFSQNFMDLITKMLATDQNQRITMEEIKNHPWVNGPTPTLQEIQGEFQQRSELVFKALEKERMEKLAQKQQQQNQNQQGYYYAGFQQFRHIDEIDELGELAKEFSNLKLTREIKQAPKEININSVYTTVDLEYLWKYLILKTKKNTNVTEVTLNDNSYKMKCKAVSDQTSLNFNIEIKAYDDDTYCIDFIRESGNLMAYHEQIKAIKQEITELSEGKKSEEVKE